jgi:hypothetical protein
VGLLVCLGAILRSHAFVTTPGLRGCAQARPGLSMTTSVVSTPVVETLSTSTLKQVSLRVLMQWRRLTEREYLQHAHLTSTVSPSRRHA